MKRLLCFSVDKNHPVSFNFFFFHVFSGVSMLFLWSTRLLETVDMTVERILLDIN